MLAGQKGCRDVRRKKPERNRSYTGGTGCRAKKPSTTGGNADCCGKNPVWQRFFYSRGYILKAFELFYGGDMKKVILGAMMMLAAGTANAADIKLPEHTTNGGMPLMEAIAARRSGRTFDTKMLSDQILTDLLWATWGISSEDGKRVVPTARNRQDMDLYVLLPSGSYLYDAAKNTLVQLGSEDLRPILAKEQKFAGDAPVHLLFVTKDKKYGEMHAGSMYQNTSLYCASAGLKCVVRGLYDRAEIKQALGLEGDYEVVMTEAAGYPKAQ